MSASRTFAQIEFEPSLLPPSKRLRRRFTISTLEAPYMVYLEERLQRDPHDLRAHVERVVQRRWMRDAMGAFAALVDLNIALGSRGRLLRESLLTSVESLLGGDQREFLRSHLDGGIRATDTRAAVPGVCLCRAQTRVELVRERNAVGESDFLTLAHTALARDDAAGACRLLEEALQLEPGRADLCAALLDLYRRGLRRADFERTRASLLGRRVALPERWDDTAAWFKGSAEHG